MCKLGVPYMGRADLPGIDSTIAPSRLVKSPDAVSDSRRSGTAPLHTPYLSACWKDISFDVV